MTTISVREAGVRSGLPETLIRTNAALGYFRTVDGGFDLRIDQDSFDQYLANQQPPENEQQEMIIRKKEVKMMVAGSEKTQEIFIQKIFVTPSMAKAWLEQDNKNYRFLDKPNLESFARAMAAGEWKLNPHGLQFDTNGLVIDGQTRLHAIIKSGVSVWMFAAFNVPKEMETVIDCGKPRRFVDHARYFGLTYRDQALALAKIMNNPKTLTYSPVRLQPFEMLELVNRFHEGIDFVLSYKSRYTKSPALSPVAMAHYYPEYREKLPRFMELFISGKSSDPKESAPIALRDIVLLRQEKNNAVLFAKAQAAVIAFNKGKPLSKLYAKGYDPESGSLVKIYFPLKTNLAGNVVPDRKGRDE